MSAPTNHSECPGYLRDLFAKHGIEITIFTARPSASPYVMDSFTCPHEVTYWPHPTDEQVVAWARDGVE